MVSRPVRILLADDHTILRAGIRAMLESLPGKQVVAEAADGQSALELTAIHRPDIAFIDIAMKGLNGLEVTAKLARSCPETRVIILSMHSNEQYVAEALRSGASGYLLKDSTAAEIDQAITAVQAGQTYLTPAVSRFSAEASRSDANTGPRELLTPRQLEVLRLIAEGNSTKQIARLLQVSPKTVETHRAQLMERLGIHEVAGLVRYAMRSGMIPPE